MEPIRKTDFHIVRNEGDVIIPTKPTVSCTICQDRGFVVDRTSNNRRDKPCECTIRKRKARRQNDLLLDSGILNMRRFEGAAFDTFDATRPGVREAYGRSVQFADDPHGWLVLLGPYGCGKTHLAAAIARARLANLDTVLVQTVPDLLDYLRSAFGSSGTYEDRFEAMKKADLLILDDYGAENDTRWAGEKMFQLLNYRYNTGAATVITSNNIELSGIDPRIFSRLHDEDLVRLVRMDKAGDYRMRSKE